MKYQRITPRKEAMEGKPSPHLKKVLKSYQLTAANTLSGPSPFLSRLESANPSPNSNGTGGGSGSGTSTPSGSSSNASGSGSGSALIIKSNFSDPNGVIHGATTSLGKVRLDERESLSREMGPDKNAMDQQQVERQESQQRPMSIGFSRSFSTGTSDSSSTTSSGSTSASPVSHYGGYDASPPPRGQSREKSPEGTAQRNRDIVMKDTGATATSDGAKGSVVPPHPKKLLHRHSSSNSNSSWNKEQQRLSAALVLASGLQHQRILHNPLNLQPPPILSAPDRATTEKRETILEGELISCFVVGGEKRMCFPQILTTVLRPFSLPQINQVCDELQIFCSRCSVEQLEVLKVTGVLPMGAHSCGLITKTDAERLVNALLHRNPPKAAVGSVAARSGVAASSPQNSFRVYHECFGKCKGIVLVNLYESTDSLCIECVECHGLFSPSRFVAHSHHRQEVRTCHWGFDSAKWRNYLLLAREEDPEKWNKTLADLKSKFDHKRKESVSSSEESYGNADDHVVIKRVRYSGDALDISTIPGGAKTVTPGRLDPALYLPSKKRLPFLQYSDNDQNNVSDLEVESVRKMLTTQLGSDGADPVIRLLEKQNSKISYLEQICRNQEKLIRRASGSQSGAELQTKVNTMEEELRSLKKQLIRRHEQREVI